MFRQVLVAGTVILKVSAAMADGSYTPPPITFDLSQTTAASTPLSQTIKGLETTFFSDPAGAFRKNVAPSNVGFGPIYLGPGTATPNLKLGISFSVPVSNVALQFGSEPFASPLVMDAFSGNTRLGGLTTPPISGFATLSYSAPSPLGVDGLRLSAPTAPYFAVANVTVVPSIAAIVQDSVKVDVIENGTAIQATFVPNYDLTIANAALLGGFTKFDWMQTVTSDPTHTAFFQAGLVAPFTDPVGFPPGTSYCLKGECTPLEQQMIMADQPANSCFSASGACPYNRVDVSDPRLGTNFKTELVGVLPNGELISLFQFTWASNYSGSNSGEVYQYGARPFDDGTGSGGIRILSETYLLTPAVPEPSTWAMMMLGFSGLVWFSRRRERRQSNRRDRLFV